MSTKQNLEDKDKALHIGGVINRFDWASASVGVLWGFALGLLVATFKCGL
tara:strand:+ start:2315 stop:2464 length:150 start_codon:yes stop_codon:yes gene_type:complete